MRTLNVLQVLFLLKKDDKQATELFKITTGTEVEVTIEEGGICKIREVIIICKNQWKLEEVIKIEMLIQIHLLKSNFNHKEKRAIIKEIIVIKVKVTLISLKI